MATVYMNDAGSGFGSTDCTATAANVLYGKTAIVSGSNDNPTPGTMPDHSGQNDAVTPALTSTGGSGYFYMKVPENGYYTTGGRLQTSGSNLGDAATGEVLSGKKFTSKYGINQTGGMTNKAGTTQDGTLDKSGTKVRIKIPVTGYYDTSAYLTSAANSSLGNAAAGNVLTGKTFSSSAGVAVSGGMTDKSGTSTAATVDMSGSNIRMKIPATGYYDTSAYLTKAASGFGDAAAANVLSGKKFTSSAGLNLTGTLQINSVTSFSVARTGNNTVGITLAVPTAATGKPWSGLYVRGKAGSYPTSRSDGFAVGSFGTTGTHTYSNSTNLANGTTVYFRGWDYIRYDTDGSASYGSTMYGNSHDIGSVYMGVEGYASITSSGTWTLPTGADRVVFFLVGGGGGGNGTGYDPDDYTWFSGGAGGGYVKQTSAYTGTGGTTKYTISIGAGGAAGTYSSSDGKRGGTTSVSNSSGTVLASALGGYGSKSTLSPPRGGNGGSGGGGAQSNGGTNGSNGGSATSGSGDMSASSYGTNNGYGQNVAYCTANGIAKRNTTYNGVVYAGGGGGAVGGAGGNGGGGRGSTTESNAAVAGTANTGGGGGGRFSGRLSANGVAGGSGIVIAYYYKS